MRAMKALGACCCLLLGALAACREGTSPRASMGPEVAIAPPRASADPSPAPSTSSAADPRPAIATAYAALDRGDRAVARDAFLRASAHGPRAGECLYQAGRASIDLGEADRARAEMDRAIAALESSTGAALRVAFAQGITAYAEGVAFSPDGALIAVAGRHDLVVFDARTLTERLRLAGSPLQGDARDALAAQLSSVAFGAGGDTVAAGTPERATLLADTATGKKLPAPTTHAQSIYGVAFSADGALFASSGLDGTTRVVRTGTRKEVASIHHKCLGDVGSIAFLDGGRSLAIPRCGSVLVEDLASGKDRIFPSPSPPASIDDIVNAFAVDDRAGQIVAGRGSRVQAFDARTGAIQGTWVGAPGGEVRSIAISPDGGIVAAGSDRGHLRVFRRDGGATLFERDGFNTPYAAFDPTGRSLAIAQVSALELRRVEGAVLRTAQAAATPWRVVARGATVAALEDDGVRVWDLDGKRPPSLARLATDRATAIALSDDGRLVAVGGVGGAVHLYSVDQRAWVWDQAGSSANAVTSIGFDARGKRIVAVARREVARQHHGAATTGIVRVRDAATGREIAGIEGGSAPCAAAFSRTGTGAWVVDEHGAIVPFAIHNGPLAGGPSLSTDARCAIALDPTRDVVAIADGAGVTLRDLGTGAVVATFPIGTDAGRTDDLTFSQDGKKIAAIFHGGDLAIWDVAHPGPAIVHRGAAEAASSLAFAPGAEAILLGSRDGAIQIWSMAAQATSLSLVGVAGSDAGAAIDATGAVETFGDASPVILCAFGALSFPFDLCRHRFERSGLVASRR